MGGVTFTYRPTYFDAVADQAIAAVQRWRTEEHAEIKMSLPEISVQNLLIAMGYTTGSDTATAIGTLSAANPPTLAQVNGTPGVTSYSYELAAISSINGDSVPSTALAVTTGAATLTATN